MGLDIVFLIIGLALIILGANYLTDGSVIVARLFKIPELVIGLTVIAIGTSTPELVVSIASAVKGESSMAVGNVIGSNIFNGLVILGFTALIRPVRLSRENSFRNIPLAIATSLLFIIFASSVFGWDFFPNSITQWQGVVLLTAFIFFMRYTIKSGNKSMSQKQPSDEKVYMTRSEKLWVAPMILGGLGGLIYGGNLFLDSSVSIARSLGISEYIISVTLMAGGTSLPELASCIVAARRGKSQLALGNVIGSNISNILLVLGATSLIHPLDLSGISPMDLVMVVGSSLVLIITPFTFKRHSIDRIEGAILILIYCGYLFLLLK